MQAKTSKNREQKIAYFMDLLSHDVLNNNQAVLGYLELILASSVIDKKTRKYAEKAVSHIRTSTILVDNVKRLMVTRDLSPSELKPTDLLAAMNGAEREVVRMFPDRKIGVKIPAGPKQVLVIGDGAAGDLVLNMLVSMVRLDSSNSVTLELKMSETVSRGRKYWQVTLADPTAEMPKIAKDRSIEEAYDEDSSIAVKMVGILYCRMMADMLGGGFEVRELNPKSESKGALFVATLLQAGEA